MSQGGTLEPTLFNIYVNDSGILPFQSKIYQYVDDAVLVLPYDNYEGAISILQRYINALMGWFKSNVILMCIV